MAVSLRQLFVFSTLLSTSMLYAGMDRFWIFSKNDDAQLSECKNLDQSQQQQLIQAYQEIKDEDKKRDLKKRMEWFCDLSEDEQLKMRQAWQSLSTKERNQLKQQFDQTSDPVRREQLRQELITKYGSTE